MAKGGAFERSICDQLSLWWTGDPGASVFWRTAGSGGRATVRAKKNKNTASHAGDIASTDPDSAPLMKFLTFELKRGYSRFTPFDLLDRPEHYNRQVWEDWINQARRSQQMADSKYWMVVQRRDKRESVCVFPSKLLREFGFQVVTSPGMAIKVSLIDSLRQPYRLTLAVMRFNHFLNLVDSGLVKDHLGCRR